MKTYELTYIVSPEITSEEAEAKAKEIESAIASKEGTILRQSNPLAKTFSYPIEKRASGFFGVLEFQAEPERLLELKEIIEKDGKIVRHMVIIKKPARIRKERAGRRVKTNEHPVSVKEGQTKVEEKEAKASAFVKTSADKPEGKGKVELKDIEQELDEILG